MQVRHGKTGAIARVKLVEPAMPAHLRKIAQIEQQVKDLRGQLTTMTGEQVSQHALLEIIHECVDGPAKPPSWRKKQTKGHTTGVPILLASDWHWDGVVTPEQVEHVNAHNCEIAVQRAGRCFRTFVDLTKNHLSKPSYDYAVLALGEDMLSGDIHEELLSRTRRRSTRACSTSLTISSPGLNCCTMRSGGCISRPSLGIMGASTKNRERRTGSTTTTTGWRISC